MQQISEAWTEFRSKWPIKTFPPVWVPPPLPSRDKSALFVYPRLKGQSASTEVDSLKIQAFLLFSGYPHIVEDCHEEDQSPSGQLPYLLTKDGRVLAGMEIIEEVNKKCDNGLDPATKADILALSALAESKLHFALIYSLWYEEKNCEAVSFPQYERNYPLPIGQLMSRLKRKSNIDWMLNRRSKLDKAEIMAEASQAIDAFSTQLGNKPFLFGDKPTYADAALFAYVHAMEQFLRNGGSEKAVKAILAKHENIVLFAQNMFAIFFAKPYSIAGHS